MTRRLPLLPIIGITGRRGAGKDELAKALKQAGFERAAFADALKDIARKLYGLSHAQVHGTIEQKERVDDRWGLSPRQILQTLGTEVGRAVHPDTWVRHLLKIDLPDREAHIVVGRAGWAIADVRFPNEAEAIRRLNGIIVKITRPSDGSFDDIASTVAQHASEGTGLFS